jgi:hypothetical protein
MSLQHQANLEFIRNKGFDANTAAGLKSALKRLNIVDGDELLYDESAGDPFDRSAGELRRNMLIHSVQMELMKLRN